jgi:delta1-piperideine-2-carboxylate reductase
MKISLQDAETWAVDILVKYDVAREDAITVAQHLVDAELRGYRLMGMSRLPRLTQFLRSTSRSPITIERDTPVATVLNGANNLGYVVARKMVDLAIDKASKQSIAVVTASNCIFTGRNGYYMDLIARAGLIGLMMNNVTPLVAPYGSSEAIFGTNPFSVGMPTSAAPLVFDIGTSSIMDGDLRLRLIEGRSLPQGVAYDSQGRPTINPADVLAAGALAAFGEHKGSGLALIVQAFGILANSPAVPQKSEESGVFMLALDPDLLLSRAEFSARLDVLLERIRNARPVEGGSKVSVPGDRSNAEMMGRSAEDQIEISDDVAAALRAL